MNFRLAKGKAYLSGGFTGRVLEGIQLAGIVSAQTGHPYTIFTKHRQRP